MGVAVWEDGSRGRLTNQGGCHLIFRRLINFCWFFFKWGLALAIGIAGVVAFHMYRQFNDTIRSQIQTRLAEHYAGLSVTLRSAELVEGEGIVAHGLSIVEPGAQGPRAELLYVDELFLRCNTDFEHLLSGTPEVSEVVIRRPVFWITRRSGDAWSASRLLPWPKFGIRPPTVRLENGRIEWFDPLRSPAASVTFRDVNLTLAGSDPAQPDVVPAERRFQGTLDGDHLRQVTVDGWLAPDHSRWLLDAKVDELEMCPETCRVLPEQLASRLGLLASCRGKLALKFHVSYDAAEATPYRYQITGRLDQGRVEDPRLPQTLSDLSGTIRCGPDGYVLDDVSARSGQSTLRMSCRAAGYEPTSPVEMQLAVRRLEVGPQLLPVLPKTLEDLWYKYMPSGLIDVDARVRYDGQQWQPELAVRCQNVSFTCQKFPYRVENTQGTLDLTGELLKISLTAQNGRQLIGITGQVYNPLDNATGAIDIRGDGIPLDEKLLSALPGTSRDVVRSLHPQGTLRVQARLWRDRPDDPMHQQLQVNVKDGAIRFEKFPYPLDHIRGSLSMEDGQWTFSEMEGTNDTGRVTCQGFLRPSPEGTQLHLNLMARDVPLEEELRDSLRPNMQQLWNDLRPRGVADIAVQIHWQANQPLDVTVRAWPQPETAAIELVQFPYRLEKLRGVLEYRDGHVTLQQLKAEHGLARLSANGQCRFLDDGSWQLALEGLTVDRLHLDRELVQAVPARMRRLLTELNLAGPVNLRGTVDFQSAGKSNDPVQVHWNMRVDFQRQSLDCGVKLENMQGELQLVGGFDGQNMSSRGELAIDSLTYRDVQLTQIMGPLWIDDQQVLLGSWVDRPRSGGPEPADPNRRPRPLTASLFGGHLYGDIWVQLGSVPRFGLQATLSEADLSRCAKEVIVGRQNLQGKILATLELRGAGRSVHCLGGHGSIRLRDADVYELPLMISLLKILSVRPPDTKAFSHSDIDYRLSGNHIYFDRIDFHGDAISLLGKGEMNFNSELQLTFNAIVGRGDLGMPVMRELLGNVVVVHVDGTIQAPQTRTEAFPGVNRALEQLARPDPKPSWIPQLGR